MNQNDNRQFDAMKLRGIPSERIFSEKLSGKDTKRPVPIGYANICIPDFRYCPCRRDNTLLRLSGMQISAYPLSGWQISSNPIFPINSTIINVCRNLHTLIFPSIRQSTCHCVSRISTFGRNLPEVKVCKYYHTLFFR